MTDKAHGSQIGVFSSLLLKLTASSDLTFPETPPKAQPGSQRAKTISQDKATFS